MMWSRILIKLICITAIYCFSSFNLFCQSGIEPSKLKQFNITVNAPDHTIKTQMLSTNKDIRVNNDRVYMWYGSQKIMETKGGYAGKLIHGSYRAFYLNNQLKEQGCIRYGLKNNEWKYWYSDGNLKEIIHWKNGVKNGAYILYNDFGQPIAKGKFRNDKLHGKFYTYSPTGTVTGKKKYKNGDEVIEKVKPVKPEKEKTVKQKIIKEKKETKKAKPQTKPLPQDTTAKKRSFFNRIFKKKTTTAKQPVTPPVEKRKVINS